MNTLTTIAVVGLVLVGGYFVWSYVGAPLLKGIPVLTDAFNDPEVKQSLGTLKLHPEWTQAQKDTYSEAAANKYMRKRPDVFSSANHAYYGNVSYG